MLWSGRSLAELSLCALGVTSQKMKAAVMIRRAISSLFGQLGARDKAIMPAVTQIPIFCSVETLKAISAILNSSWSSRLNHIGSTCKRRGGWLMQPRRTLLKHSLCLRPG